MLFVIIGRDADNSKETRPLYRPAHLERLEKMYAEGKLIIAGPFTDVTGSLIIIESDSLESAQKWAEEDPFYINGVYKSVEVKPFKQVLPTVD